MSDYIKVPVYSCQFIQEKPLHNNAQEKINDDNSNQEEFNKNVFYFHVQDDQVVKEFAYDIIIFQQNESANVAI